MNNVDRYLSSILRKLDVPYKEKQNLKLEFKDHISSLEDNYISEGYNSDEASKLAIEAFNNDEFFIKSFNDNSTKLSYIARGLAVIIFVVITLLFKLGFDAARGLSAVNTLTNLIPLNFAFIVIKNIANRGIFHLSVIVEIRLFSLFLFIPIGFLVPIIINRLNSCITNLKVYITIIILWQVMDTHRNIDFIIFSILACLLGYSILKIMIRVNKLLFNKLK